MGGTIRVLLSNPAAEAVATDHGTWVVAGLKRDTLTRLVREVEEPTSVRERVADVAEDAAIAFVGDDAVHAYRTVVGSHRLYALRATDGAFVIADHFRDALSQLAPDDRRVPPSAVADHLLYRAPIPPATFVEGIEAVAQGEWVAWDLGDGTTTRTQIDRLAPARGSGDPVAELDRTLADLLAAGVDESDALNMYSGGVDSTLVQTYLDDVPMLHVGVDSPEYAFEVEYARRGSSKFDAPFSGELVREDDVLSRLEAAVDALGTPSMPLMTPLMDAAFERSSGRTCVMAIGADTLYGDKGTKSARVAAALSPPLASPLAKPLASALPGAIGEQVEWLSTVARQQSRDPAHPESFPQQFAAYTRPELVGRLLGDDLVAERCRAQMDYVAERVDLPAGRQAARQLQLAHLTALFSHRIGSRWRQLAATHGSGLVTPFETRSATECALGVPAERRYVTRRGTGLVTKYLLKDLLDRRLPSYATDKKKGSGVLPFERYRSDGPLSDAFERYEVPEFVPANHREAAVERSGRQAWNLLTYAVWRDRVLRSPDLEPTSATRTFEWDSAAASLQSPAGNN
jgi:asparagine synthase (glutamine-hydrolysing)